MMDVKSSALFSKAIIVQIYDNIHMDLLFQCLPRRGTVATVTQVQNLRQLITNMNDGLQFASMQTTCISYTANYSPC